MPALIMNYVDVVRPATPFQTIGRSFFGLAIVGVGLMHFIFPGLQPLLAPIPAEAVWGGFGYAVGAVLIMVGMAILLAWNLQTSSLFVGILFLLFFVFGHLPNRLTHHPERLGYWTDAIKLLALAGGAFRLSATSGQAEVAGTHRKWASFVSSGKYLYALMLILFGIDHFLYADLVKSMVPGWLPAPLFWTYATGLALIGSGLSIATGFRTSLIALLLAAMLFLWLVLLHLPATIKYPLGNGNSVISSLECLAFSGIALLLSDAHEPRNQVPNR